MKEHVETIPELDHSSIRLSVQDITGQPFRLMLKHMSRSVINVNDSVTSLDSRWIDYFTKWVEAEPLAKITQ